jgi:hypothetical protein
MKTLLPTVAAFTLLAGVAAAQEETTMTLDRVRATVLNAANTSFTSNDAAAG